MNLLWAGLVVVVVTALAITAMLLVRRRAPAGSYFEDGDRAAGVFGVLATGFAVLLGFVVFLAFESFDTSRSGAEAEAQIVTQQFETAQFFPAAVRARLSGELVCYARTVIHQEWPQMQAGTLGDTVNPWGVATFRTLKTVEPRSASEQTAYSKWLDQRSDRERCAGRPNPRRRGSDPGAALDRAAAQRSDHLRVHAVLRRQRRARRRAGDDDGRRGDRDLVDAAAPVVPRQSVPRRRRRTPACRDGARESGSSTRRRRTSAGSSRSRATSEGPRVAAETATALPFLVRACRPEAKVMQGDARLCERALREAPYPLPQSSGASRRAKAKTLPWRGRRERPECSARTGNLACDLRRAKGEDAAVGGLSRAGARHRHM